MTNEIKRRAVVAGVTMLRLYDYVAAASVAGYLRFNTALTAFTM
jgi:hypothetical protein